SWWIAPLIDGTFGERVSTWKLIYDPAGQRVFCFPNNEDTAWVLHKHLLFGPNRQIGGKNISPWSKWTTSAVDGLRVTAIGVFFDPTDSPALLSTSPGAGFTNFSGGVTPTIFFGVGGAGGGGGGGIFSLKKSPEDEQVAQWVIGGESGKLATSPNGLIWTLQTSSVEGDGLSDGRIDGLAKGDDIWVGCTGGGKIIYSTDTVNWSNTGVISPFIIQDVMWWPDESKFVAVAWDTFGNGGEVYTSTNGIDWIQTKVWADDPDPDFFGPESICHDGNGLLFASGDEGSGMGVARSTDAVTWTIVSGLNTVPAFGGGGVCASDLAASPTLAVGGPGNSGAGEAPDIHNSTDAISWTLYTDPGVPDTGQFTGLAFGNSTWVAVGSVSILLTSSDAQTWAIETSPVIA
ncbi:hypothetical protein LCGC14_2820980, partial [marine sediment metagenome]